MICTVSVCYHCPSLPTFSAHGCGKGVSPSWTFQAAGPFWFLKYCSWSVAASEVLPGRKQYCAYTLWHTGHLWSVIQYCYQHSARSLYPLALLLCKCSSGLMLLPLKVPCFFKLCCLTCFNFLSLLSGLCILWVHPLVPFHHPIPPCLCCAVS